MRLTRLLDRVRGKFLGRSLWERRGAPSPAPRPVKYAVLARYAIPGAMWIESGTHQGLTTTFLAKVSERVVTIEPDPSLASGARGRFIGSSRITVVEGRSQDVLANLLREHREGPINLWLDGHYSGHGTFLDTRETPILDELLIISEFLSESACQPLAVMIDDVRLFAGSPLTEGERNFETGYPRVGALTDWAHRHGLWWTIEHDIFCAVVPRG